MDQGVAAIAAETDVAPAPAAGRRAGRPMLRAAILAVVLIGAVCVATLTPLRNWLTKDYAQQAIEALGVWFYPACVACVAVLVSCGVPRLLFCALGGAALGFWAGLALVQLGTILGYYSVFLFIRWGGRDWALHHFPKLRKWSELVRDQGSVAVILARQIPLHGTLINLCLGLSRVKHRHFLIGTAIGLLTEAIPATLVGAGLVKSSFKDMAGYFVMAVIAFGLIWLAAGWWLRRARQGAMKGVVES